MSSVLGILLIFLHVPAALGQDLVLSCPNDWTEIYANCYVVVPDSPLSWTQALATCNRFGGRLAEPVGYDVTEQIGNLLKSDAATTKRVWTGYNRRGHSTVSDTIGYWSDGRATTVDVGVWGVFEPKVTSGDCAYLQQKDGSWKMYMGECDTLMPFVCQALPCPSGTFRCDSGKCIGSGNMCNGENNCGDFSDERNCNSKCSFYLTGREGVVTYPSGDDNYEQKTTCQWAIEGAIGSRLQISFLSLATEKGLDFVEVWVGGRTIATSTLLHRLSGTTINSSSRYIISPNNNVIVRFISDFSDQFGGFSFRWNSDFRCGMLSMPLTRNDAGTSSTTQSVFTSEDCQRQCVNSPSCVAFVFNNINLSCQVFSTMPRAVSDTCCELSVKTCPQEVGDTTVPSIPNLGGTLYATVTPQRLHSPLYPVYYLAEATMAWTIIATSRRVVSLEFLDIDLAEGDAVAVLDGDGPSSPTVAIITQGSQHSTLISTGTSFYVLFKTSEISRTKRGFLLSYQSGCDMEISATSGTISSPGYLTGQYPSILSCSWLLKVTTPLRLTFKSNFGLENGKDFLRVYKANDVSGTPVHSGSGFTGSVSPGQIDTEDGSLYVHLYTSATGTDVGFTADFTAGCPLIIDSTLEIQPPDYARYHGDKITVFCRVGYVFSTAEFSDRNSILLTCSEGKWNMDPVPTCSRVFCGSPPSINNGALVTVTGLYGGNTATFTCSTGYSTIQQQTITCLSNGQWATPPTCSAPSCAPLPTILNGNFVTLKGNGFDHGSVVRYSCIVGYDIIGVDTLTCTQGVWSGQRPLCAKVKCGLPFIEHASLSPSSGVNVNEDVSVSCDSEYRLSGQQTFKCGIDTPPKCINIDECTEGTSGCSQVCKDKDGGFTCSCNEGYRSISVGSAVCEDINECSYSNGGCTHTCENFPGGYRCTCPTGYQLYTYNGLGGILIPIGETGDKPWNLYHINHTCIKQTCPPPALTITNGKVTTKQTSFSFGDQVTYICDIGYYLQGQGTRQCISGNTWSAPAPVCVEATCPQLIIPQGSANTPTVSPQSSISYLSYFTLTCSLSGADSTTEERPCYYNKQSNTYQVSSTSLTCQRAECGKPPFISGATSYTTSCTKTGCQFLFECKSPLFTREGTSSSNDFYVRCGSDGQWDFNNLRCSGPTCKDPGTPPGAQQVATSYEEYSLVYYRCDRELKGFLPTNPYPLECVYNYQNGSLHWNATMPTCTDQERPFFYNCPSSERSVRRFNPLPIIDPNPQDNSNLLLRRSVSPANFIGNRTLIASDTQVLYEAEDYAGNIGTCSINVKVIDEEPPILTCRDSFNYQLTNEFDSQTFDVTTFASATDNLGSSSLQFSVTQLFLDKNSIGTIHTITVTARDDANNEDTCIIQVTVAGPVCVPWTLNIENGQKSCLNTIVGSQCTITCNSGYTLFEQNDAVTTTIQCSFTTGWPTLPKCVRKTRTPYRYAPRFRYVTATVITTECESSYQNDMSNKIAALLPSLSALCQGQVPSVTVSLPTNHSPVTISSFSGVVTGTFNLEFLPHGYSASQYSQCVNTIKTAFSTSNNIISNVLQLAQVGSCAASSRGTYNGAATEGIGCYGVEEIRSSAVESGNICVACPPGFVISGSQCSQCGPHSYREMASVSCLPCPPASLNFGSGLTSLAECYRVCPRGTVSSSGEAPCNQCPVNTYSINTTYCQPCPTGQVTRGSGHSSNTACKNRCQPGTYSSTGLAPCLSCPKAFNQPSAGATTCLECSSFTTTSSVGATSSAQCITAISSVCPSNRCLNGGTCRVVNHDYFCDCPPDFTGSVCETELKACDSSPCYNNGFCINQGALTYTCHCLSSRYSGLRCEIDRNDCEFNPCRNNGSCHDKVGAYTCLCPSFSEYTGSSCSVPRQPCTDNPCPANAQCVAAGNLRRKCVCSPGLTGPDCTQDIDECLSNPCLNGGTCRNGNNSFSCECASGYGGRVCEVRNGLCFPNSCGSQGTCIDDYINDRTMCICAPGYESLNNLCVAKNPCSSLPCMNGATCQASGSTFSCRCLPGYEGFHCQHETDECASQPCKNGATCVDRYLDYTCICEPGKADTGGKNCEDLHNDCTPFPCDTVGTIRCNDLFKDYQCTCRDGYFGKNCSKGDTDCESFPCRHGGTCTDIGTNAYSCSCPNGFTGKNCETRINYCASNSCINGGTCINSDTTFNCICPAGFLGLTCSGVYDICSISRPCLGPGSSCRNNGNTATCQCSTGYDGDNCEQRTSQCSATSCENGGTCNDNLGAAQCTCPAGTSGDRCQTNTDDCASGPCPAGSVCVDGINAYTCQCQPNRIGATCQKAVSSDFDVAFPGPSTYLVDALSTPQTLGSQSLSLSVWVRYTAQTPQGIIATLYGLSTSAIENTAQELLRLEKDRVTVKNPSSTGQSQISFTSLDDGRWHHIVLVWDSSSRQLSMYIDGTFINEQQYGWNTNIPSYIWLVLDGTYDSAKRTVDQSLGMVGRISRLSLVPRILTTSERESLYSNKDLTLSDTILGFTSDMIDGINGLVDYNSELTAGVCASGSQGCRTLDTVTSSPNLTSCPDDQLRIPPRESTPAWPVPVFSGATTVRANYVSGESKLTWGTYGVAYAGSDEDGDAAMCTFRLYNRRTACVVPTQPLFGDETCTVIEGGFRCTVQCTENNFAMATPGPKYYSCGVHGMYKEADTPLPYELSACTSCTEPKHDIVVTMDFLMQSLCSGPLQTQNMEELQRQIKRALTDINNQWRQELCNAATCSDVNVQTVCMQDTRMMAVTIRLLTVKTALTNANSLKMSAQEILSVAIIDEKKFDFQLGTPIVSSFLTVDVPTCDSGRQLTGDCCAECGPGSYFNTDMGKCVVCQRGSYLVDVGQVGTALSSPCQLCAGGKTTPNTGAQTEDECRVTCLLGNFYNLTVGQCQECPLGFYQPATGTFYCEPCGVGLTTETVGSSSVTQCGNDFVGGTTTSSPPNTGASTAGNTDWVLIAIIIIIILLILLLIILIVCCCCRGVIERCCPCLVTKVVPEGGTQWHYVDRFGETNMKFVSYKMGDYRAEKSDKQALVSESGSEDGSVQTNISVQVPIFEEKLNGTSQTSKQKDFQNAQSGNDSKISTKDLTSGEYRAVTPMPAIEEVKELSPHGSDSLINKALEYNGLSPNFEQNGVAPSSTHFGRASPSNLSRMSTHSQNDEISYVDQNLINSQTELLQNEEGVLSDSDNMTYQTNQTTDSAEENPRPVLPSPNTVAMLEEETWATVVETDGGESLRSRSSSPTPPPKKQGKKKDRKSKKSKMKTQAQSPQSPSHPSRAASAPGGPKPRPRTAVSSSGPRAHSTKKGRH